MSGLARRAALAPFRTGNYRFQWPADLLTSWAFEMEALVLGRYAVSGLALMLLIALLWREDLWHLHTRSNAR